MNTFKSLEEYIREKKLTTRGIPASISERWNARVIPEKLHLLGEDGAIIYLTRYGRRISEQKIVQLALKAEFEGYPEIALGFWKQAFEIISNPSNVRTIKNNKSYFETGPISFNTKIKILFLAANPVDTNRLRLDAEIRAIDQSLRKAEFRNRFELQQHWAVQIMDIEEYLLRHRPDIVHFSGHGSRASEIILEEASGRSRPVSANALERLFSILRDNIKCVVLNACYSEQQAQAIAQSIDCVIGMSTAIGDAAAIGFAAAFYQALGYGRDIKTAFDLGCVQINLEGLNEQDTPKLIALRSNPKELVLT